jgi:hypothetical protein
MAKYFQVRQKFQRSTSDDEDEPVWRCSLKPMQDKNLNSSNPNVKFKQRLPFEINTNNKNAHKRTIHNVSINDTKTNPAFFEGILRT